MKNYIHWLKENWSYICPILAIYLLIFLFAFVRTEDTVLFLILLTIPLYLLHESEEYIFPGGFAKFFNLHIFKSDREDAPMDINFIFYVNILLIWVLLPIFGLLAIRHYYFGLWMIYFFFFAGVAHIALGIKGRQKYNPGLIVSLLINIPYGLAVIYYLSTIGLLPHPFWNVHLLIGLGLNLMLPVMGVILQKKYKASLAKTK